MAVRDVLEVKGDKEMLARVKDIAAKAPEEVKASMYRFCEKIMTAAKDFYVPVDLGALKNSGTVELPKKEGDGFSVKLYFGGTTAPYALVQHENLHYSHNVGEAKYLERPIKSFAPQLLTHIVREVRFL